MNSAVIGVYSKLKIHVIWDRSEIIGFAFANNASQNPKHEIRNSKQYKMTKIVRAALGLPNLRLGPLFQITQTKKLGFVQMGLFRSLGHSVFEFVSDFDIRVSNLEMAIMQIPVRGYPKARSSGPGLFARSKSIRGRPL